MIKQECIGIPDMILLLMIFCFKKIKIKAEIVLSPGGAYFFDHAPHTEVFEHPSLRATIPQLLGPVVRMRASQTGGSGFESRTVL